VFNWLITGQITSVNPAAAVRRPKLVVKTGKTPMLDGKEWHKLIDSIPTDTVRDLRDRALIATLTYSFARITAALRMKVEDLRPKGAGWQIQLHEKGGKEHAMPCHHALADTLRAYIDAAGIAEDRKGLAVSHQLPTQCDSVSRAAHGAGERLAHDPPPCCQRRHHGTDRQPYISGDRHHRLSRHWRRARTRAVNGGA
jgi:integrase